MAQDKLTNAARGRPCTFRLPGCAPGPDNETVVFCHAPSTTKGMGLKSESWWGADGCRPCHDRLDGRTAWPTYLGSKAGVWMDAIHETLANRFETGLLVAT